MTTLTAMPKYEVYKDSGVEWLGSIPLHWQLLANKNLFKIRKLLVGKRSGEYDLLSLTLRGVIKRDMENPEGKFPAEFDTYQEVRAGDFIFCLFDVEETPRTVGLSDFNGMITGAYTVFEVNDKFDKKFLYYFYLNLDKDKRLKPLYRGLRNTIPKDSFMAFKSFIPSKMEQTAIANFLDEKTAKIDEALAIKEKQIELLKERKQIIIQQAVTQGLDPTVPMKDSGVEWIGQIPAHWEIKKIKHLGYIYSGDAIVNNQLSDEGLYEVFGGNGLMGFCNKFNVTDNCIIIGRVGALCGNIRLINERKWISDNALILKLNNGVNYKYIADILVVAELNKLNTSNAQPLITGTKVLNYYLPVAPVSEQQAICDFIELIKIKSSESETILYKQIVKLKEYKNTLINSAVTGKIKVV